MKKCDKSTKSKVAETAKPELAKIISITSKLIQFKTTDNRLDELKKCMNYIETYFRRINRKYRAGLHIRKFSKNNKPSLVVTFKNTKKPKIFLNGHIDVVHAEPEQFRPRIKGDRIHGRGSADMKAGIAIIMHLFEELCREDLEPKKCPKPNIGAMIVSDEEKGSYNTTPHLVKKGFIPEFFITTEASDEHIGYAAKGIIGVTILSKGKPCHASMPWLGKDPVDAFVTDYTKLRKLIRNPAKPEFKRTMCLTVIRAGDSSNRVPSELIAKLNIRTTSDSEQKNTVQLIKRIMKKHKLRFAIDPGVSNDQKNKSIQLLARTYKKITGDNAKFMKDHGASDARFFSRKNIPAITFGPTGKDLHGNKEWVSIKSMERAHKVLYETVRTQL